MSKNIRKLISSAPFVPATEPFLAGDLGPLPLRSNNLFPQLADELWIRLGHIGWTVKEIVHDNERHPCELIEELAGADVLLTAHGFQVSSCQASCVYPCGTSLVGRRLTW